jgi:hypothetical protein
VSAKCKIVRMAWTTADLAKLDLAYASGASKVKYGDQEIEYRSITEYKRLREMMLQDINNKPGAIPKRLYAQFSKGIQ